MTSSETGFKIKEKDVFGGVFVRKFTALLSAAAVCLSLTGCAWMTYQADTDIGIIGGADGPTAVFIAKEAGFTTTISSAVESKSVPEQSLEDILAALPEVRDGRSYLGCEYLEPTQLTEQEISPLALDALLCSQAYEEVCAAATENSHIPPQIICTPMSCCSDTDGDGIMTYGCDIIGDSIMAYSYDLNGDGSSEQVILYRLMPDTSVGDETMWSAVWGAIDPNAPYIAVLCSDNGCYVSDIRYAVNAEVSVLSYGGFAQFVISGGASNNSSHADYFGYDGEFSLQLREFRKCSIMDGVFLVSTMAQCHNAWLTVWDSAAGGYVSPEAVQLSEQQSAAVKSALNVTDERAVSLLAGEFLLCGDRSYRISDGEAEEFFVYDIYPLGNRHDRYNQEFTTPRADDISYNTAVTSAAGQ